MRDWVNSPCEYGCGCGECYSRSPDQEDSHHCIERGYEKRQTVRIATEVPGRIKIEPDKGGVPIEHA